MDDLQNTWSSQISILSTLIIITLTQSNSLKMDVESLLIRIQQTWFVKPRPKCLVILYERTKLAQSLETVRRLLVKGFEIHFLNLSFLLIYQNPMRSSDLIYLQTSSWTVRKSLLYTKTIIFPNKVKNMGGYKFRLGVTHQYIVRREELKLHRSISLGQFRGGNYMFVRDFFAKTLNLSVRIVGKSEYFDMIHLDVQFENLYKKFAMSQAMEVAAIVAAVPNLPTHQSFTLQLMVFLFLIILSIIAFFMLVAKIFRLPTQRWSWIKIYSILLEESMNVEGMSEKVVYLFLIGTSLFMANQLISDATDVSLGSVQQTVDSYEELSRLDFSIFSLRMWNMYNGASKDLREWLLRRTTFIFDRELPECLLLLAKKQDRICICESYNFDAVCPHLKNVHLISPQKTNFYLSTDLRGQMFVPGSMYVEEFDRIHLRSIETGFIRFMSPKRIQEAIGSISQSAADMGTSDGEALVVMLNAVVFVGLALSLIIFVGELLAKFIKKKIRREQFKLARARMN